jgi:hypothetical protein
VSGQHRRSDKVEATNRNLLFFGDFQIFTAGACEHTKREIEKGEGKINKQKEERDRGRGANSQTLIGIGIIDDG